MPIIYDGTHLYMTNIYGHIADMSLNSKFLTEIGLCCCNDCIITDPSMALFYLLFTEKNIKNMLVTLKTRHKHKLD